jgi:hypothetical protein
MVCALLLVGFFFQYNKSSCNINILKEAKQKSRHDDLLNSKSVINQEAIHLINLMLKKKINKFN